MPRGVPGSGKSGRRGGPRTPNARPMLPLTPELAMFFNRIRAHFQPEAFGQLVYHFRRGNLLDNIERVLTSYDGPTADPLRFRNNPLSVGHLLVYTHHIFTREMVLELERQFIAVDMFDSDSGANSDNGFGQFYCRQHSYLEWATTFIRVVFSGTDAFVDELGQPATVPGMFPWLI